MACTVTSMRAQNVTGSPFATILLLPKQSPSLTLPDTDPNHIDYYVIRVTSLPPVKNDNIPSHLRRKSCPRLSFLAKGLASRTAPRQLGLPCCALCILIDSPFLAQVNSATTVLESAWYRPRTPLVQRKFHDPKGRAQSIGFCREDLATDGRLRMCMPSSWNLIHE